MATPKEFSRNDGPFVCALEEALQRFGVERQAYHGGSFVGNHVHTCLRVSPSQMTSKYKLQLLLPITTIACRPATSKA